MYKNSIEGWMTDEELGWLYETAKGMDSIVEVGSWKGRSTHALLSGCTGSVTAVDHFMGSPNELDAHSEAKDGTLYEQFIRNVGTFKNLRTMRMDSLSAAKCFKGKTQMVFIDGGHSYEEVKADIEAWMPKAAMLLCGHDYSPHWPGVMKAVNERFGTVRTVGSIWIHEIS